jgi:hypothetical protein
MENVRKITNWLFTELKQLKLLCNIIASQRDKLRGFTTRDRIVVLRKIRIFDEIIKGHSVYGMKSHSYPPGLRPQKYSM